MQSQNDKGNSSTKTSSGKKVEVLIKKKAFDTGGVESFEGSS